MDINISRDPSTNIPQLRWKYTIGSLVFLGLVACAVIIGIVSVFIDTGYAEILESTSFVLFVTFGFAFVYFTEKLMGFRRPGPKRQEKLVAMMREHEDVAEYCRKVAKQERYLVVDEYDAIVAHVQRMEGEKSPPEAGE